MLDRFKSEMVDTGALAKLALDIFGKHFKYFILIGLGIHIPVGLVLELMTSRIDWSMLIQTGDISSMMGIIVTSGVIALAILPLETAALTYFAGKELVGDEASAEGIMDATFGNWYKLFVTSFIYFSIGITGLFIIISVIFRGSLGNILLGFVIIIPAIIFGKLANFCQSLVVADNLFGFAAIRKSIKIVKRRWRRTLIIWVFIWLTEMILKTVVGGFISVLERVVILLLGSQSVFLQIIAVLTSAITDTACMLFGLFGALYFFNLYYTYNTEEEAIL